MINLQSLILFSLANPLTLTISVLPTELLPDCRCLSFLKEDKIDTALLMQSKMWAGSMLFISQKGDLSFQLNRVQAWAASLGEDVN